MSSTNISQDLKYESKLPEGFIYLDTINPKIIANLMYYGNFNFIGKTIDGYKTNRVILTKEAAEALNIAWKKFDAHGYNLVIYDSYRPQKAVNNFIKWSEDERYDQNMKKVFFPHINHNDAFKLGYIATKSGHTRGSTIDLTIIKKESKLKFLKDFTINDQNLIDRELSDSRKVIYINDGTVDMGTSVDLMDEASNSDSKLVNEIAQANRKYFINVMKEAGFENYATEWWHFTLKNEPHKEDKPENYFNFDIE